MLLLFSILIKMVKFHLKVFKFFLDIVLVFFFLTFVILILLFVFYYYLINYDIIIVRPRLNFCLTLKTLNLFLLCFIKRSDSENHVNHNEFLCVKCTNV